MSEISYNANSTIVQKYQRSIISKVKLRKVSPLTTNNHKRQLRNNIVTGLDINKQSGSNEINISNTNNHNIIETYDEPFDSKYPKNSTDYLRELCLSIYPSTLNNDIKRIKHSSQINLHAIIALLLKTFIQSWYGSKIDIANDDFMSQLFFIAKRAVDYVTISEVNVDSLLLDDIPYILAQHYITLEKIYENDNYCDKKKIFDDYCLTQNQEPDYYPILITSIVKNHLKSNSELQNTFVESLINKIILTKVVDNISEPYYILKGISKACDSLLDEKATQNKKDLSVNLLQKLSYFYSKYKKIKLEYLRMKIDLDNNQTTPNLKKVNEQKYIFDYYMSTFILIDILHLDLKYPFLYTMTTFIQYLLSFIPFVKYSINVIVFTYLHEKFLKENFSSTLLVMIRALLFPNDNLMGHSSPIPTGLEYENYKNECINKIWQLIELHNLDAFLLINQKDVNSFVNILVLNQKCNKQLLYMINDNILAHLDKNR